MPLAIRPSLIQLLKGGHGIFNVYNDLGACYAHKCETGINESSLSSLWAINSFSLNIYTLYRSISSHWSGVDSENLKRTFLHPVASRSSAPGHLICSPAHQPASFGLQYFENIPRNPVMMVMGTFFTSAGTKSGISPSESSLIIAWELCACSV